jgi:hypothetical protein
MAQRWAAWNCTSLLICVVSYIALGVAAERLRPFEGMPWEQSTTVLAAVVFAIGGMLVFAFRGGFWTQTLFTVLVPVLAQIALELTRGSDPAYPGLTALLAVPLAVLFFLGAVFIGGPLFLWRQSRTKSHLTAR